jgi:hypothetical protein
VAAASSPLHGEEKLAAFSMSIDEFVQLAEADQKSLLASAFEHRLQHAKNIHYEALMLINISEYDAETEKPGKILQRLNGSRLSHWVLEDSSRMDTDRGGADVSKPLQFAAVGFNAASGVVRSTVHFNDRERSFGRIGVKMDQINNFNRYSYWLNGERISQGDLIIRDLLDSRAQYRIEVPAASDRVHLTIPWTPYGSSGSRTFLLDPEKGFLPVHGKGRWELDRSTGKKSWRTEEFIVVESQLVEDVWMPTRLKEVIRASTLDDTKANVYDITVSEIEAGTVTPEDVEVPFSIGMEIVDSIEGVAYVIGPMGERTRVQPLVDQKPQ